MSDSTVDMGAGVTEAPDAAPNDPGTRIQEGHGEEAFALAETALRHAEEVYGPDHLEITPHLDALAEAYTDLERPTEAEALYQRALSIREQSLGPDHLDVAKSLWQLADLYERGKPSPYGRWGCDDEARAKARPLRERVLAIYEKAYGPEHPELIPALHHITNGIENTQAILLRILGIQEKFLGPDHLDVADTLSILADRDYDDDDDYISIDTEDSTHFDFVSFTDNASIQKRIELHKRVLAIREKALGPNHPSLINSLDFLASAYSRRLSTIRSSWSIKKRIRHIIYTHDYTRYSDYDIYLYCYLRKKYTINCHKKDIAKAADFYDKFFQILMNSPHKNVLCVGFDSSRLVKLYCEKGQYENALALCERELPCMESVNGPMEHIVLRTLSSFAYVYALRGQYDQVTRVLDREMRIRAVEPTHGFCIPVPGVNSTAYEFLERKRYEVAEELHKLSLLSAEKGYGENSHLTAPYVYDLAYLYDKRGRLTEALELYERALRIMDSDQDPESSSTAPLLVRIARIQALSGQYDLAIPFYERTLTMLIQPGAYASEDPFYRSDRREHFRVSILCICAVGLASIYLAKGDYRKAISTYNKAISRFDAHYPQETAEKKFLLINLREIYRTNGMRHEERETTGQIKTLQASIQNHLSYHKTIFFMKQTGIYRIERRSFMDRVRLALTNLTASWRRST